MNSTPRVVTARATQCHSTLPSYIVIRRPDESAVECLGDPLLQGLERAIRQGCPELPKQIQRPRHVMYGREPISQELVCPEQVRQIGARVIPARFAGAGCIDRAVIILVARIAQVEPAVARPHLAGASHPRGQDAVEEVDAALDGNEEVRRCADAHQAVSYTHLRAHETDSY